MMKRRVFTQSLRRFSLAVPVFAAACLAQTASAQIAPEPGLDPSDAARALAQEAAAAAPEPARTHPQQAARPASTHAPAAFVIRQVRFANASAYLESEALMQIAARFENRRASRATLAALLGAVDALYAAREAGLARAELVSVDAYSRIITLRLNEARLGRVTYDAGDISDRYLTYRLGVQAGDIADTRHISNGLTRLALTDGLQTQAAFSPGVAVGTTDLAVQLAAPPRFAGYAGIDNYGTDDKGRNQFRFRVSAPNLTGWNDALTLDGTLSAGNRALSLAYARVITSAGGKLAFALTAERGKPLTGPKRNTRGTAVLLSYIHPLALSEARQIYATASVERFVERSTIGAIALADQAGVAVTFGLAGLHQKNLRTPQRLSWSVNLTAGRYEDGVLGQKGLSFARLNASFSLLRRVDRVGVVSLSAVLQAPLTRDAPSRGGLTVTSAFAVPGYLEGLSSGAGGYWLRAQIERSDRWQGLPAAIDLRPYGFIAAGEAFDNTGGSWVGQGFVASAGFGLSGVIASKLRADILIAKPFTTLAGQGTGKKPTLRASLTMTF